MVQYDICELGLGLTLFETDGMFLTLTLTLTLTPTLTLTLTLTPTAVVLPSNIPVGGIRMEVSCLIVFWSTLYYVPA